MTHWTISRLKDWQTCPARYDYAYNKTGTIKPAPSPAADRGTEIHASIESYLRNESDQLDARISPAWRRQLRHLRTIGAIPEQQWELSEGWFPHTDGAPVWLRAKIDAHWFIENGVLGLVDFKTGKPYLTNVEQLEVYAVMGFALYDDVDTIEGGLWYLDSDEPHEKTFKRADVSKLARKWEGRASPLLTAKEFPYRPGDHCRWCPFREVCPAALQPA